MILKFLIKKKMTLISAQLGNGRGISNACLSGKDHKNGLRIWGWIWDRGRRVECRRMWSRDASKSLEGKRDSSPR